MSESAWCRGSRPSLCARTGSLQGATNAQSGSVRKRDQSKQAVELDEETVSAGTNMSSGVRQEASDETQWNWNGENPVGVKMEMQIEFLSWQRFGTSI